MLNSVLPVGGNRLFSKSAMLGERGVAGPAAPVAPSGAIRAFAYHPNYCTSDASHLVPCADGDTTRFIKDLVSGTWYEQATAGARATFRAAGSGKYYGVGNGSSVTHAIGDFTGVNANLFSYGLAYRIITGTNLATLYSNGSSNRDFRQTGTSGQVQVIINTGAGTLSDPTASTIGTDFTHVVSFGATTTLYRNGASVASAADSTGATVMTAVSNLFSLNGTVRFAEVWLYGAVFYASTLDAAGAATAHTWLRSLYQ